MSRPFKVWEPFLFALQLWLVVLALASLFLYGGLFLDFRVGTAPIFTTLGLAMAFLSSVAAGLYLVGKANEQPLLSPGTSHTLRRASGYALRLGAIIVGVGAAGVYGGWFLDDVLQTRPLLTVVGILTGYLGGVLLALRYTRTVIRGMGSPQ